MKVLLKFCQCFVGVQLPRAGPQRVVAVPLDLHPSSCLFPWSTLDLRSSYACASILDPSLSCHLDFLAWPQACLIIMDLVTIWAVSWPWSPSLDMLSLSCPGAVGLCLCQWGHCLRLPCHLPWLPAHQPLWGCPPHYSLKTSVFVIEVWC